MAEVTEIIGIEPVQGIARATTGAALVIVSVPVGIWFAYPAGEIVGLSFVTLLFFGAAIWLTILSTRGRVDPLLFGAGTLVWTLVAGVGFTVAYRQAGDAVREALFLLPVLGIGFNGFALGLLHKRHRDARAAEERSR